MITQALNSVRTAASGCCDTLCSASSTGANWLGTTAKSVWSAVCPFFTVIAQGFSKFFTATKDTVFGGCAALKNGFTALPAEFKIAGAVALVLAAIGTAVYKYRLPPLANANAVPSAGAVPSAVSSTV